MTPMGNRGNEVDVDHPALWQQHWHQVLDTHAPDEDSADSKHDVLPAPSDDARLHTAFWLSAARRTHRRVHKPCTSCLRETACLDLRDTLGDMAEKHGGRVGMQAFYFLSEPLYQLAASYEVADWIRWPLCASPDADDPTLPIYQLATGGWSPGWDDKGVFLFDRRRVTATSAVPIEHIAR